MWGLASGEGWGAHVRNSPSPACLYCSQAGSNRACLHVGALASVPCRWELGGIGPEGLNKAVTPPSPLFPSWCRVVSIGATPNSGVGDALFQQNLRHLLWVASSLSHRVLGQSHPAQDGCPAPFPPEVCGSLSMPLFLSVSRVVFWTHQGWGWGQAAGLRWHPEASQMLPLLGLALG